MSRSMLPRSLEVANNFIQDTEPYNVRALLAHDPEVSHKRE